MTKGNSSESFFLSIKFDPRPFHRYQINMAAPRWMIEILDHLKTQGMCEETMRINPLSLSYVPDHPQTQEMCNAAVMEDPW